MMPGRQSGGSPPDPTYVTVSDAGYFLGTVALVNSLRLTGNAGSIVVLDTGLSAAQRERLSTQCDVRSAPVAAAGIIPLYLKPTVAMLGLHGLVVLIDSDMIVTGKLQSLYEPAVEGRLCAFPDALPERRFDEWRPALGIEAPLRIQTYVNAGFLALDIVEWEATLRRWWMLCDLGRGLRSPVPWGADDPELIARDPFLWGDQDILNAILMSEVPADSVYPLPEELVGVPHWPHYEAGAKIVDRRSLEVVENGVRLAILHYWDHPKPWLPAARTQLSFEAYVELMARLLTADDVPVRLPRNSLSTWLRDDLAGRLSRRWPRRARGAAKSALGFLPPSIKRPVKRWLGRG